jgi:hypothetical protein
MVDAWDRGDHWFVFLGMDGVSRVSHQDGKHPQQAALLLGALRRLSEHFGMGYTDIEIEELDKLRAGLEAVAGAAVITNAWEQGYSMSVDEIFDFAIRYPLADGEPYLANGVSCTMSLPDIHPDLHANPAGAPPGRTT